MTDARLALSREFGVQEYFTPEDIAEALGTTEFTITGETEQGRRILELAAELIKSSVEKERAVKE